jgi:hypothetical protein
MDPVDLRGLPFINHNARVTQWIPPEELPKEGEGILFLDELNLAAPSVQHAAYQLILQRRLGSYRLPEGWVCFAAGNRIEDRAHVIQLPSPLANRFVHLSVGVPPIEVWEEWARKNDILPEIIAFLAYDPDNLFQFDPNNVSTAYPTPRSWEFCSKLLKESNILQKLIKSTRERVNYLNLEMEFLEITSMAVGRKAGADFLAFIEILSKYNPERELLRQKASIPKDFRERLAYVTALATHVRYSDLDLKKAFLTLLTDELNKKIEPELFMLGIHLFASVIELREVLNSMDESYAKIIYRKIEPFIMDREETE